MYDHLPAPWPNYRWAVPLCCGAKMRLQSGSPLLSEEFVCDACGQVSPWVQEKIFTGTREPRPSTYGKRNAWTLEEKKHILHMLAKIWCSDAHPELRLGQAIRNAFAVKGLALEDYLAGVADLTLVRLLDEYYQEGLPESLYAPFPLQKE